ncbi:MAG: 2-oxo acid dehydrogenase subunit E2 [Pedosphaera sp.]|nr:2-oxo acid dehydrogenase subunit E2 [Pedosphaera sp.]
MPVEITLPRLGWSMEEGTFLGWLKKDGDNVKEGEPIFTLENEKAAQDVESIDWGILCILSDAPKSGAVVKVGCLLGYLLKPGEALPLVPPPISAVTVSAAASPLSILNASTRPHQEGTPASPRARRAARENEIDLATLHSTGRGGRIRERDVLASVVSKPLKQSQTVPITALRRTIAERMLQSLQKTAPVTLHCRCDATSLVALRLRLKSIASESAVPSYTDIIAKLTANALSNHPMLAGRWDDPFIRLPDSFHIGIAVDTEQGLVVPVLRDVAKLSLSAIAQQSHRLIELARNKGLKPADLQGYCFTLSNLGHLGIEAFTPIINYPETAILGLGAIVRDPVALADGTLVSRDQLTLSLTFDHRIVDGAPAARFLQNLRQFIEAPLDWLL